MIRFLLYSAAAYLFAQAWTTAPDWYMAGPFALAGVLLLAAAGVWSHRGTVHVP